MPRHKGSTLDTIVIFCPQSKLGQRLVQFPSKQFVFQWDKCCIHRYSTVIRRCTCSIISQPKTLSVCHHINSKTIYHSYCHCPCATLPWEFEALNTILYASYLGSVHQVLVQGLFTKVQSCKNIAQNSNNWGKPLTSIRKYSELLVSHNHEWNCTVND